MPDRERRRPTGSQDWDASAKNRGAYHLMQPARATHGPFRVWWASQGLDLQADRRCGSYPTQRHACTELGRGQYTHTGWTDSGDRSGRPSHCIHRPNGSCGLQCLTIRDHKALEPISKGSRSLAQQLRPSTARCRLELMVRKHLKSRTYPVFWTMELEPRRRRLRRRVS